MIEQTDLMKLFENYKIDYKKVMIDKVLDKGEYFGIKHVLEYLVNEVGINPKNIEKCPSILYLNVNEVRKNYEFLKQEKINISDVETCLHVLSTDNKDLKETYYYVLENYGLTIINRTTSILSCNKDRIINIEKYGLSKDVTISASISRRTIYEIEEIIKICKKYNIEIKGTVFKQNAEEIEKIIEVCKKYNMEITSSVFLRSAEEIEKITEVCKKYNIEITGSVFMKSADEIERIIEVCKKYNIEITGSVFYKSAEEIEKIVEICKKYNIEITGSVFLKKSSSLQKTINFIIENYDERYLTPLIIAKEPKHLSEVMPYLDSLGVLEFIINSASILTLTKEEIEKRVEIIKLLGEDIVKNGKFNSVFGMNKTRLNKKLNSYKDNDVIYPLIEDYIVK